MRLELLLVVLVVEVILFLLLSSQVVDWVEEMKCERDLEDCIGIILVRWVIRDCTGLESRVILPSSRITDSVRLGCE